MRLVKLAEVRVKCVEGRFFAYDDWRDRLFVPPAIIIIWLFVRLRLSAGFASWLSGLVVMAGAWGLSQDNQYWVLVGSFGYMLYYFLDYVDGGIARYNGKSGIGGQYLDWIIHVIAAVGTMAGLTVGAIRVTGIWLAPFGIMALIAASLTMARFSMAWFAICMERQQRVFKDAPLETSATFSPQPPKRLYAFIRRFSALLFHENYAIFLLPLLALCQLYIKNMPDFRVGLVLAGGTIYLYVMFSEVQRLASKNYLDNAYNKLFSNARPDLPKDHFFG